MKPAAQTRSPSGVVLRTGTRGGFPEVHLWCLVKLWCDHAGKAHLLPQHR